MCLVSNFKNNSQNVENKKITLKTSTLINVNNLSYCE